MVTHQCRHVIIIEGDLSSAGNGVLCCKSRSVGRGGEGVTAMLVPSHHPLDPAWLLWGLLRILRRRGARNWLGITNVRLGGRTTTWRRGTLLLPLRSLLGHFCGPAEPIVFGKSRWVRSRSGQRCQRKSHRCPPERSSPFHPFDASAKYLDAFFTLMPV